ncbi:MAG: hypothetical protein LBE61_09495 [Burkholderiaceae bacterium]|jgi:hypothetical protein|nr:hypothetical protein [Burkholderiaceae bacterium]
MKTPTDTERLNWLERRGPDVICFTDGTALDIANSPMNLRAELDAQIEQEKEEQHAA